MRGGYLVFASNKSHPSKSLGVLSHEDPFFLPFNLSLHVLRISDLTLRLQNPLDDLLKQRFLGPTPELLVHGGSRVLALLTSS